MSKSPKFKILRVLNLLPILAWPLVFYVSIFIFDDPSANPKYQWLLFYSMNAYPLYLIGNVILSNWLYHKYRLASFMLLLIPIIFVVLVILRVILLSIFVI